MELIDIDNRIRGIEKLFTIREKTVLAIEEAAMFTGLSKGHLYKLTSAGQVPHYKPAGGRVYFKKTELEAWLLRNRQHATEEINAAETHTARKR